MLVESLREYVANGQKTKKSISTNSNQKKNRGGPRTEGDRRYRVADLNFYLKNDLRPTIYVQVPLRLKIVNIYNNFEYLSNDFNI